jgi:hypothetical protein
MPLNQEWFAIQSYDPAKSPGQMAYEVLIISLTRRGVGAHNRPLWSGLSKCEKECWEITARAAFEQTVRNMESANGQQEREQSKALRGQPGLQDHIRHQPHQIEEA